METKILADFQIYISVPLNTIFQMSALLIEKRSDHWREVLIKYFASKEGRYFENRPSFE